MVKLKDIVGLLKTSFRVNKVPEPLSSSYFVLEKALNTSQRFLRRHPNAPISLYYYNKIQKYTQRRLRHEPIQYILGEWDFRDLNLKMQRPTLIPRPETEQLVDIALELFAKHEGRFHFVDVGCGSGAITLALLKEKPKSQGVAIDISLPALKLTLSNFYRVFGKDADLDSRLDLIQTNFKAFADKNVHKFDLIISNPPYIPSNDVKKLEKQILMYEDKKALDGGEYGLDVVWELIRNASTELKSGGFLVIEVNLGHPEYLEQYFRDHNDVVHNMTFYGTREDFTYRKRFVILQKKPKQGQEGKDKSSDESD